MPPKEIIIQTPQTLDNPISSLGMIIQESETDWDFAPNEEIGYDVK